jgi:hypothetical protein
MSQNNTVNNLITENQMLHRMLSEKDCLLININNKLLNMEDQMNQLIEQNKNMKLEMSRFMAYLVSFTSDCSVKKDDN